MAVIFSTHPLHPDVTRDLSALGDYRVSSAPYAKEIIAESQGADIIVVRAPIPAEVLMREPQLRACVRHGAGLDMIPMDIATQQRIVVANVPGANARTVAEHILWSAMSLLRKHTAVHMDLRQHGWESARRHAPQGRELSGRTLGVLGFGNIGRTVARMAGAGFGMSVIAHTRRPSSLPGEVTPVTFETLLEQSDVLALACPLTEETRGLIDAQALGRMKSGAILVNVSRGPVVDEKALLDALNGHLGGAALDVFTDQPLAPDHPFLSMSNVVLTPHMAGITEESMLRLGLGVVGEVRKILAGEMPQNFCNPEVEAGYRARFAD